MSLLVQSSTGAGFSAKRSGKSHAAGKLNLVSLMDIFTILVFFLMVNTGDVEVLQPDEKVALPKSFTQIKPDTSPVIKVNAEAIYFKEQLVVDISQPVSSGKDKDMIDGLYQQLLAEKENSKRQPLLDAEGEEIQSISVMGDAAVPYALLKRVLYTCAQAGYRDVALAVEYSTQSLNEQVPNSDGGSAA